MTRPVRSATMSDMRLPLLALATGVAVAFTAAPASATTPAALPQATPSTAPAAPPDVVDPAPVFTPEDTPGQFAYPSVFLVPIALLAAAGWSARAFTRDLSVSTG